MKLTVKGSTMVKPMQKTPSDSVWLSNLDLVFPTNYHSRGVHFYRPNGAVNFFDAQVLKAALSRTLVEFYLCAGRLRKDNNGRLEINCNGEGVLFLEVECDGTIDDLGGFSPRPDISLVPVVDYSNGISSFPLSLLQVTRFKCGGVSLGIANEHHVSDGISALDFIKTWSEIARGLTPAVAPSLDRRPLLSPRNPPRPEFTHVEHHPPPSLKTPLPYDSGATSFSTFRLTCDQINFLKQKCGGDSSSFTTYEVVAGHVWRCASVARGLPEDQETRLQVTVDGRGRLRPPLPPSFFGNGVFFTGAVALSGELGSKPVRFAAGKVQEAIGRMEGDYLRSALDYVELNLRNNNNGNGIVRDERHVSCPNFEVVNWTRLPGYEADFGWGKPVYCGPGAVMSEGKSFLFPDPQNEGSFLLQITLHKQALEPFGKLLYNEMFVVSKI